MADDTISLKLSIREADSVTASLLIYKALLDNADNLNRVLLAEQHAAQIAQQHGTALTAEEVGSLYLRMR